MRMSFNQSIFESIFAISGKSSFIDLSGIFLAKYFPYILIFVFLIILFFEKNWKIRFRNFALVSLPIIIARGIALELFRFLYYKPRPELVVSIQPLIDTPGVSSFPSGHAAVFFALAIAVFFINRKLGYWFFAGAILIGLARIFTGVHWPMDIIAGFFVGVISAYLVKKLLKF